MSQSTRTEIDRILAEAVTADLKIKRLRLEAMTALPGRQQQLFSEIGELRSSLTRYDAQLQALQQGRAA